MKPWQGQINNLVGQGGEAAAKRHLEAQGYSIIEENWRCSIGEIDLIARKNRMIVFVEVKTSKTIASAIQRISEGQRRRIANAAQLWIRENAFNPQYFFRFDAILVGSDQKLQHIEGAWTT
jgi:putative endonuclease